MTISTVGYGDVAPTTTAGRVIGCVLFYVGAILMALPVGVIGAHFSHYYYVWQASELRAKILQTRSPSISTSNRKTYRRNSSSAELRRISYVTRALSDSEVDVSDLVEHHANSNSTISNSASGNIQEQKQLPISSVEMVDMFQAAPNGKSDSRVVSNNNQGHTTI